MAGFKRDRNSQILMVGKIKKLMDKGCTPSQIANELNIPESFVRKWYDKISDIKKQ